MTQQHWTRRVLGSRVLTVALLLTPWTASAQDTDRSSFLVDVAKDVVSDPTTYAPSIIAYHATMRDWTTSQPFFRNGFLERNPRFTVSGLPNDVAVTYGEGNRRILLDALGNVQMSLLNNAADRLIERVLINRFPNRRKLIRTIGWIERISLGAYLSYRLSAAHYRQTKRNEQAAQQYGFR